MPSLTGIISSFPRWSISVLIVPEYVSGEPMGYHVYPLRRSRKGIYYFSYFWEEVDLPYIIKLFDLEQCILLKNGRILGIEKYSRKDEYGFIKSHGVLGFVEEDGTVYTAQL